MGLFDRIFRRAPQKRGRGPARSGKERIDAEKARYLARLRKENPSLYDEMMRQELGLAQRTEAIDFDTVLKVKEYLNALGLKIVPAKGGTALDDEGLRGWIRDLAPMVPEVARMFAQVSQSGVAAIAPVLPPTAPPPARSPIQEMPIASQIPEESQMTLIAQYVIGQFQQLGPDGAAKWLADQPHPAAKQLIERIQQTPDEQIPQLLNEIVQTAPDFAGVVSWLRQRPAWLMDLVRHIHALGEQAPQKPQMGL